MLQAKIYHNDWDVDSRLHPFGVRRAELLPIVQSVVGARAEAVEDDPLSSAGTFAYIFGTRSVRVAFRRNGWMIRRDRNIESVRHPEHMLDVVYQSVDFACSEFHLPQAISGKGNGADRMIDLAQGSLFSQSQLTSSQIESIGPVNSGLWFFCVSVNGDDVRAELSLPSSVKSGNFEGFIERIFIVRPGEWSTLKPARLTDGVVEIEPSISRRV